MKSKATWIGIGLSAGAIALLFWRVNFKDLAASLKNADPTWIAISLVVFLTMFFLRAWRWSTILGGTPFMTTWYANVIGYMFNILLPLRLGEIARAYVIGKKTDVSMARALSGVVVERIIDLAAVLLMFAYFATQVPMGESFTRAATLGSVFVAACVLFAGLLVWKGAAVEAIVRPRLEARGGKAAADRWLKRFHEIREGIASIGSAKRLAMVAVQTALIWGVTILIAVTCMKAFLPDGNEPTRSGIVVVMANLGGALPSAPGGLGIVQGFATSALVVPYHVPEDKALAFVLVWSLGQQVVLVVLGMIAMSRIGMKWGELREGAGASAAVQPSSD